MIFNIQYSTILFNSTHPYDCDTLDQFETSTLEPVTGSKVSTVSGWRQPFQFTYVLPLWCPIILHNPCITTLQNLHYTTGFILVTGAKLLEKIWQKLDTSGSFMLKGSAKAARPPKTDLQLKRVCFYVAWFCDLLDLLNTSACDILQAVMRNMANWLTWYCILIYCEFNQFPRVSLL